MTVSVRMSHMILVLTSALLVLAWASQEGVLLMMAVASLVLAGQIVGQSTMAAEKSRPSAEKSRSS